ncbi:MAG: STAS/SEC14 domain-containing protein [Candidatus Omnitrophica bacterium]|nr:STAS/SEC14 domain-containing protein [Candidatus Omnitrophota bacterium]
MKYAIAFDPFMPGCVVKTSGKMTGAEFIAMAESLLAQGQLKPDGNVIFDYRDLDFSRVSIDDLEAIRRFHKENEDRIGSGKSAMVVRPGFLKKWYALWSQGQKVQTKNRVMVFESLENATQWIMT